MPERTRAEIASDFQHAAVNTISGRDTGAMTNAEAIAFAQLSATIALCQRVADLTDKVEKGLGGIEDRLSEINAAVRN